jgi:hypothetical protein
MNCLVNNVKFRVRAAHRQGSPPLRISSSKTWEVHFTETPLTFAAGASCKLVAEVWTVCYSSFIPRSLLLTS